MHPEPIAAVAGPAWFRIDRQDPDLPAALHRGVAELEARTGVPLGDGPGCLRLAVASAARPPAGPGESVEFSALPPLATAIHRSPERFLLVLAAPESVAWAAHRDPSTGRPSLAIAGRSGAGEPGEPERRAIVAALRSLESEPSNSGERIELSFIVLEDGLAFLTWRRSAETAPEARIRVLVDLVAEGALAPEDALRRLDPAAVAALVEGRFDPDARERAAREGRLLARGRPVRGGIARGRLATSPGEVEAELGHPEEERRPWILAARELAPGDVGAIEASCGVLLASDGVDGPGAVLASELDTPCVASLERMEVGRDEVRFGARRVVRRGDWISVDASAGEVWEGRLPVALPESGGALGAVLEWADRRRRMSVRVNADTLAEARRGFALGAEGVSLVRTEHLLYAPEVAPDLRAVVEHALAGEPPPEAARSRLVRFQGEEYGWLLRTALGRPVTVRLLDLPLHELLGPASAGGPETNPMLGLRGPRLAALSPEVYGMQLEALRRAAGEVRAEGRPVRLEVLLPMISTVREFEELAARVRDRLGPDVEVGAMIEVPRAALLAGALARSADFLAFGTNDLTQMTLGISRVDADRFVGAYVERGWLSADPFRTLDLEGVGALVARAVDEARRARPSTRIGVCGAHAADGPSIRFFESIGIDYLGCAPELVAPVRLAAAQARIG